LHAGNQASMALAERAVVAMERGAWDHAAELSDRGVDLMRRARLEEYVTSFIVYAAAARTALHRGDPSTAGEHVARAQRLRPRLTYAFSFFAVQARLELARALLGLADPAGARTLLREVDEIHGRRGDLGVLGDKTIELRSQLPTAGAHAAGASTLTSAELRLLPYLPLHFSFREIADRLHVSPHTVKSQAISLYRKLGVTSRGAAISQARQVGMIE
jgi:LuxR family transcriptional regulator, maltose regulon positive regulatory protein